MGRYLISGVSRGIGRSLATQLLADGHEVFGIARGPAPESTGAPGLTGGPELTGVAELDLREFSRYPSALAELLAMVPALDGFVHCAGVVRPGALADQDPLDFAEQFAINVTAAAELVRCWLPALRAAAGTVVLVNSGSGLNTRPPLSSYGASKFALRGYADALRQEEPALRVSTVYPGRTDTRMQRAVRAAESGAYRAAEYLRPETVAEVIRSLLLLPRDAVITDVTIRPTGQAGPSSPDAHR